MTNAEPYLGEVGGNERHTDPEVCLVEVIGHIPAQLAVLAPLLNHSVEQSQNPHQWPECLHDSMCYAHCALLWLRSDDRLIDYWQAVAACRHKLPALVVHSQLYSF